MSNPYYTYSGSLIPGMLARAEAVASELQGIQAGFADLAISGVDSGTGSAYVVTTPAGQPSVTLVDGDMVSFKAGNTNPGAATLKVNNLPAASVLRLNGTPLQLGDISANSWYTLVYNSSFSAWTLYVPPATVTFGGTISSAAPVHKVGLVAAAGTATSAAPIDVTFAIDQTIVPSWTGVHTFSAGIVAAGTATSTFNSIVVTGNITLGSSISVSGTSTFGSINVSGTSTFGLLDATTLSVNGTATLGALTVSGLTTLTGGATALGTSTFAAVVINGTSAAGVGILQVRGASTFSGPPNNLALTMTGTGFAGYAIKISGTSTLTSGEMVIYQDAGYNGFVGINSDAILHLQVKGLDFITVNAANGVQISGANMETSSSALSVGGTFTGVLLYGAASFVAGTGYAYGLAAFPSSANSSFAIDFETTGTATPGSSSTQGWGHFGTGYYGTGTAGALTLTNKPGTSTTSAQWLAVSLNGSLYWMPAIPH